MTHLRCLPLLMAICVLPLVSSGKEPAKTPDKATAKKPAASKPAADADTQTPACEQSAKPAAKKADKAKKKPKAPKEEGFVSLFNGKNLDGWVGDVDGYAAEDGSLVCLHGGRLFTEKQYDNFILRLDFKVPPGGNNGVGIRSPLTGRSAYDGIEIQVLDNDAPKYAKLKPYQFHGSVYGVVPAKRGFLKPPGEWNSEEIRADGSKITVTLNGTVIVDADLSTIKETMDHREHPGLHNEKGHIGFLGHGARVEFRNIRIKPLD